MTPSDLIAELHLDAPHQRVMAQHFFLVLATYWYELTISDGQPITDQTDARTLLLQCADELRRTAASAPPQPRYKSETA